jgi:hypothetical protein
MRPSKITAARMSLIFGVIAAVYLLVYFFIMRSLETLQ